MQKDLRGLLSSQGANTKGKKDILVKRARALLQRNAQASSVPTSLPSTPDSANMTMASCFSSSCCSTT